VLLFLVDIGAAFIVKGCTYAHIIPGGPN